MVSEKMSKKDEYLFIIQGNMTPFHRATLAKLLMKKAEQLGCGMACNYTGDGGDGELTWKEMMDKKNHPDQ